MRLIDLLNKEYFDNIKTDLINSKIFIPDIVRGWLSFDEIRKSFDESLRERYTHEKMEHRRSTSSVVIALDLINFIEENNYYGLVYDYQELFDYLKNMIDVEYLECYGIISKQEKQKFKKEYIEFLKFYDKYVILH